MKTLVKLPKIDARRAGAIALAFGLLGLGLDAAIAHFAGREMKSTAQLIPPVAAVLMLAIVPFAWRGVADKTLRIVLRVAGAIAMVVGILGSAFHGRVFMMLMEGVELSFENIEVALRIAPPLAAPGAFIGFGALLLLLASPRFELSFKPREPRAPRAPVNAAANAIA